MKKIEFVGRIRERVSYYFKPTLYFNFKGANKTRYWTLQDALKQFPVGVKIRIVFEQIGDAKNAKERKDYRSRRRKTDLI